MASSSRLRERQSGPPSKPELIGAFCHAIPQADRPAVACRELTRCRHFRDTARTDATSSFRRLVTRSLSVRVGCGHSHDGAREGGNLHRHWLSQQRTRLRRQHRVSYSCRSARSSALRTVLRYRATLRFRSLRSTWCACGETRRRRMSVASSTLRSGWRAPWTLSA